MTTAKEEAPTADISGGVRTRAVLPLDPNFTFDQFERDGDSDWYRITLEDGENYAFNGTGSLRLTLRDAAGGELASDVGDSEYDAGFEFRPAREGTYYVEVEGDRGRYQVRADEDAGRDPGTAAPLAVGQARDGSLFYQFDEDLYRVRLERGETYDFDLETQQHDAGLTLTDRGGAIIVQAGDTTTGSREVAIGGFEAPATGTYFLRVDGDGTRRFDYEVSARETPTGPGPREIRLTGGDDTFDGDDRSGLKVFGLGGDDDITLFGDDTVAIGGSGDDSLIARAAAYGGHGDDFFDIAALITDGGAGDDVIDLFVPQNARITGGPGRDTFLAQNGSPPAERDTLVDFTPGQDVLSLEIVADSAAEDGTVRPFRFVGTAEFDGPLQVRYEVAGGRTLIEADVDGRGAAPDFTFEIPRAVTLRASDFLLGVPTGPGDDEFAGTPYADVVDGGGGRDVLAGGPGHDRLAADGGRGDILDGGPGGDFLTLFDTRDGEALGGDGDDSLIGSDLGDILRAGAGDDRIEALEGNDILNGDAGNDRLLGGSGTDRLTGDEGDDILDGGEGGDDLSGGAGADRFVFGAEAAADAAATGSRDTVFDFASGDGDLLDLAGIDANRGAAGNQAFVFVGTRAFSAAGQLRVERDDDGLRLQASTDLDRVPEFEVALSGTPTLTADEFVL